MLSERRHAPNMLMFGLLEPPGHRLAVQPHKTRGPDVKHGSDVPSLATKTPSVGNTVRMYKLARPTFLSNRVEQCAKETHSQLLDSPGSLFPDGCSPPAHNAQCRASQAPLPQS